MSNFKSFLKHGGNYLIASVATSALSFISIPVYTRMLSTEDYGIISIFTGLISVLASIMAFSTDRSISRYYFDKKSELDFKRFVGTTAVLTLSFFILNSILLLIFAEKFGQLVGLNINVVYLIIPITAINIIGLSFEQIYGPLKMSKHIAISSVVKVFLGFALSICFVFVFEKDKYFGYIIGQIVAGFFIVYFWVRLIKPYFKKSFDTSYVKYIFLYSVPLIPYALSGVIIEQFGKIALGSTVGISEAGFYHLALSISGIVNIAIGVTHQAWNPYYFEYMNSKNYKQLDSDFIKIFKLTIIIAFCVASFGKEIGLLLAKVEFSGSLYLIPIFTIGYIFSQLSFAYIRNFGYTKKTLYMSITILVSGISNVVLNVYFIKSYGELGASISFVLSYIIMYLLAWFINSFFVKLHSTATKKLLTPILIVSPFYFFLYYVVDLHVFWAEFAIKTLAICSLTTLLLWKEKKSVIIFIKSKLNN